jgi:hypothetical protein
VKKNRFLMAGKTATDVRFWGDQCKAFIMEDILHSFFMNCQCGLYHLSTGFFNSKLLLGVKNKLQSGPTSALQKCDAGAR